MCFIDKKTLIKMIKIEFYSVKNENNIKIYFIDKNVILL